jgi:hypothetical protein
MTGEKPGPGEARFVRDGKASIQISLPAQDAAEIRKRLEDLGFEITSNAETPSVVLGGWLPVEKLEALAEIEGIIRVAPFRR